MTTISVVVHGALGKMGQEVIKAVTTANDMTPIAAADGMAATDALILPNSSVTIPLSNNLGDVLDNASVVVDFSSAAGAMDVIRQGANHKVNVVIGSTGLSDSNYKEAADLANTHEVGIIIAPNFALGAVLMIHLAGIASKYFDYADLTEMHHEAKIDAPSGTAIAIANAAIEGREGSFLAPKAEKELIPNTRGGDSKGVTIHSARMPGRVAHHELVFGTLGQTLTIRHDSINRESFMPGVTLAIREVIDRTGLTVGLDKILGL